MPDLVAFLVAAGPLAIMVTKSVDFIRNALDKADTWPKWSWNVAAFAIGVGYCLLFAVNLMNNIAFRPEVAGRLNGVWGSVITGLAIGGVASFWHEHMSAASAKSTALYSEAASNTPTTVVE